MLHGRCIKYCMQIKNALHYCSTTGHGPIIIREARKLDKWAPRDPRDSQVQR